MTLKLAQFCDDPQKISTKYSYPQKIFIFLKTQTNIEIQNLNPKNSPNLRMCENIRIPPWGCNMPPTLKVILGSIVLIRLITLITCRNVLKLLASSCFSREVSVNLHQKGW